MAERSEEDLVIGHDAPQECEVCAGSGILLY